MISIPTFDGKILIWKSFEEQFDATIYSKAGLNDIEKLTYLQDLLKIVQVDLWLRDWLERPTIMRKPSSAWRSDTIGHD